MRKILILVMLLILAVTVQSQDDDCQPTTEGDLLRIGAIFPQGTLLSLASGEHLAGAQAMLDAYSVCGGGRPVEWLYEPANDREDAETAVQNLLAEGVTLIVGSGSLAVRESLERQSQDGDFVLWEVSETLTGTSDYAFTPRPTYRQLGEAAMAFAQGELQSTLGLGQLNLALIYEDRSRGEQIAAGIRNTFDSLPAMEIGYSDNLRNTYTIAESIRDDGINLVMLGAFDDDADWLWSAMRNADANVAAWMHIGSTSYRAGLCERYGSSEGMISVSASGPVNGDYREALDGALLREFREQYVRANSELPSERALVSASGMYLLLRYVVPTLENDMSPDDIRTAIMALNVPPFSGLMGEGYRVVDGINAVPGVLIQQNQNGAFCTLWPVEVATCALPVELFLTWRERALREENAICDDDSV